MTRLIATFLVALAGALGGCSLINAEAPLGSEPVALEGTRLNGIWMLFTRVRDGGAQAKEEVSGGSLFVVHVRDGVNGIADLLVVPQDEELDDLLRYEAVLLQHNGVVFANFRLLHFKGRAGNFLNEAAVMRRAVGVVVVDQWSADEMRVRVFDPKRAKEWVKQGKLAARVLDFDPLREGYTGEVATRTLLLGRMTAEQLDALTTPEALADLFPGERREQGKVIETFARKIALPQRSRRQE